MTSAILVYSVAGGLAMAVPGGGSPTRGWAGLRFMAGLALLCLILYLANPVLRLPVSVGAWSAVAAAGCGLALAARRIARAREVEFGLLAHPVVVLPVGLLAILAVHGPIDYLPVSWDEFSNWLGWSRQIFVTDSHWTPSMSIGQVGYTPGWALLMAFPNIVLGSFREVHSASVQFLLHVGVLGLVFDLLRDRLRDGGAGPRLATGLAWLFVLAVLGVEATWKLHPTLQLIEKPQIYAMAAVLLTALAGGTAGADRDRLAAMIGLFLAFGYLLKMAMLTFVPAAALLAMTLHGEGRRGVAGLGLRLALALTPVVLAALSWRMASPETGGCMSNPLKLLSVGDPAALAPASCVSVKISLYAPSAAGAASFDYVSVRQVQTTWAVLT
ncbi:MAG: hypothetical protein ABT940_12550, partial [Alphaproteobacteria bacterium]